MLLLRKKKIRNSIVTRLHITEQKEELAQSLICTWECPAWLETEAGVSVKVVPNGAESTGESLNGVEFSVLKAKEPEFIKKIAETGEEEE